MKKLQLNEVIPIALKHLFKHLPRSTSLTLSGSTITLSQSVRNLGIIFNTSLPFENYVNSVFKSILWTVQQQQNNNKKDLPH